MISQLRNIGNVYDLLALCSSYVLNEIEKKPYEFGLFQEEEFDFLWDAIESYCAERKENGHQIAFRRLRECIIDLMTPEPSIEKCFAVIKFIDELVEVELNSRLLGGNHIIEYGALNEQYTNRIRITPKNLESLHDRNNRQYEMENDNGLYTLLRNRRECACSKLDREMANYKVWDEIHIKNYPLQIYYLDEEYPATKHFREKGEITFGLVPFTSKSLQNILDLRFMEKTFYIEGMYKDVEKELKRCYDVICHKSETEGIDFLVFPEMIMTKYIISGNNTLFDYKEKKERGIQFIINGTVWENFTNRSIVTNGNKKEIFSYYKKEPFLLEKDGVKYKEYLNQEKNRNYIIMEIAGIGRISVGICKDLISEEVKMFHKYIGTDILFVPAYTNSGDMLASAEELSKEYNCIVIVANACSAFEQKVLDSGSKMLSFITVPAKNAGSRSVVLRQYYSCKCYENCVRGCIGVKVCVDFLHTEQYASGLSYKMEESPF